MKKNKIWGDSGGSYGRGELVDLWCFWQKISNKRES